MLQLVEEQPPPSRFRLKKPAAPVSGGGSENLRHCSSSLCFLLAPKVEWSTLLVPRLEFFPLKKWRQGGLHAT